MIRLWGKRNRCQLHSCFSIGLAKMASLFLFMAISFPYAQTWSVSSPNSDLVIEVKQDIVTTIASNQRNCYFRVLLSGDMVIDWSPLGLMTNDQNFVTNLTFESELETTINETYTLPSGKRSTYLNNCKELCLTFKNANNRQVRFYLRAYNEAAAFSYELPGTGSTQINGEVSGFTLPSGSTGWGHTPGNDEKTYDQFNAGAAAVTCAIPILFKTTDAWVLLTEASVYGDYSGSVYTSKNATKNVYQTVPISGQQGAISGTLPWKLPWRVAIIGSTLGPVVESSVVENLNPPCELTDVSWIKSGRSSWSWLSQNTGDLNQQKRYIDFASQMGWEYNLVDDGFNKANVAEVCRYGEQKNVGNELWYNYTDVKTQAQQQSAFSQCRNWGFKSLKIDFIFDNWNENTNCNNNMMKWYDMTARNLAENKLMVTFHGCTVPRGQRRRWPHIMTYEGVLGYEWIGRGYPGTKHNCMLPYTRNVIGPMDHTPVLFTLGQLTNGSGSVRTSTDAHELALTVIYESGIQHFADKPDAYNASIGKPFLQDVPSAWDDIHFIDGVPGESVIMARRKDNDWYVAGISALGAKTMNVPLSFLKAGSYTVDLYKDSTGGTKYTMAKQTITINPSTPLSVWVNANGGFCCKIPDSYDAAVSTLHGSGNPASVRKNNGINRPGLYHYIRGDKRDERSLKSSSRILDLSGKEISAKNSRHLPQRALITVPSK